ncbi:MAG: hypothetical protein FD174_2536 [Geobacteraceae bacterium]|nr:MAG: hypothetical protein FD174_2536 [Geobacteraceae bacterium]
MSLSEFDNDYWVNFWRTSQILDNSDPQMQIGRTINKIPISEQNWELTLNFIENKLKIYKSDVILDLCAGNGLITLPISLKCKTVTAVDISEPLLTRIDTKKNKNVTCILEDVRKITFEAESFDKVILYFALQHFNDQDVIDILEKVYLWLKPGGLFYIGDIPDIDKFFVYYNTQERIDSFIHSVKTNTRAIGTWFNKVMLTYMASYAGYTKSEIVVQPTYMINYHYRFDILITK